MRALTRVTLLCAALAAGLPALAEFPVVTLGKKMSATSKLEWETRETGHPVLGSIRVGILKTPVETAVGNAKVSSRAYVSCERSVNRIAIEVTNGTGPDDPGGLKPKTMPRLVCNRPVEYGSEKLIQEELDAAWHLNDIGDALARGFRPFPIRECVTISVLQDVLLPEGWSQPSAKIRFDIAPYARELDPVFVECGENAAWAPGEVPLVAAASLAPPPTPTPQPQATPVVSAPPKAAPAPAPPPPPRPVAAVAAPAKPPPPASDPPWQEASIAPSGRTNVRAAPNLTSSIVVQLDPGAVILVRKTANEWWQAKSWMGAAFEGFIRQDRLVFKK